MRVCCRLLLLCTVYGVLCTGRKRLNVAYASDGRQLGDVSSHKSADPLAALSPTKGSASTSAITPQAMLPKLTQALSLYPDAAIVFQAAATVLRCVTQLPPSLPTLCAHL